MTDLELERLCAEAMGYRYKTHEDNDDVNFNFPGVYLYDSGSNMWNKGYYPLHDDAQAMALARRYPLVFESAVIEWCNHVRRNESFDINHYFCKLIAEGKR